MLMAPLDQESVIDNHCYFIMHHQCDFLDVISVFYCDVAVRRTCMLCYTASKPHGVAGTVYRIGTVHFMADKNTPN